jgi:hypothetical protein
MCCGLDVVSWQRRRAGRRLGYSDPIGWSWSRAQVSLRSVHRTRTRTCAVSGGPPILGPCVRGSERMRPTRQGPGLVWVAAAGRGPGAIDMHDVVEPNGHGDPTACMRNCRQNAAACCACRDAAGRLAIDPSTRPLVVTAGTTVQLTRQRQEHVASNLQLYLEHRLHPCIAPGGFARSCFVLLV